MHRVSDTVLIGRFLVGVWRLRLRARPVVVGCCVGWLLLLTSLPVLSGAWVTRHYGSIEGMPVSSATDAAIDRDGFLWLATHDGLARFDGREFSVYDAADYPQMGGNRIGALYRHAAGDLYALGAGNEWLRLNSQGVSRVRPDPEHPDAKVRYVHRDSLCITLASGMYCAGADGMQLRRQFPAGLDVELAVPDGPRDWLLVKDKGVLLCSGPSCQDLRTGPVTGPASPARSPALVHADHLLLGLPTGLLRVSSQASPDWLARISERLVDILQLRAEPDGSVLVGTASGLFRLVDGHWQSAWPGSTRAETVALSWRAPDGALWSSANGLLMREHAVVLQSLGSITSLMFADDGSVIVTTLRDGLYLLAQPRVALLGGSNLYGLSEAADGSLWMGSLGEGLFRRWPDGRMRNYGRADGLPGAHIWAVAAAPDQRVYAASYAPGIWQWERDSDRFSRVELPARLDEAQIRAFSVDAEDHLWVAGSMGAWQRNDNGWRQRWPLTDSSLVLALAHEPNGTTWFGGESGLWRQDARQSWEVAAALLSGVTVRGLYRAGDGAIWASTEGRGLVRVAPDDPHGLHAVRLGRAEGLPSNSPHAVIEDDRGDLWVNSNQGIFRLSRRGLDEFLSGRARVLSPLTLGLADGLTELEGNGGVQPAAALDRDGGIWFPSQRGVVRVDPKRLPLRVQAPLAVIDGIDSQGQTVRIHDGTLDLGVRAVQLRYNAADLHAGAEVRFRYRLHPVERDWTEAGSRRVAAFAALSPGSYRFELAAGNADGFWAAQPVSIEFTVPPYWHETRAFQLSLLLALGAGAAALGYWRMARFRRRAQLLDAQVHARTEELSAEKQRVEATLSALAQAHGALAQTHDQIESRNRRLADQAARLEALDRFRSRLLADVSHELRTPLMLIQLPLRDVIERSALLSSADRQALQLPLQQSERLGQLVEQLVGLVQAEAGQLRLKVQRLDLADWALQLVAGYQALADRSHVSLSMQTTQQPLWIYADVSHLATILGNLIDNAIKYAPAHSSVRVQLATPSDASVRVSVLDHGKGYPPELAESLFERFFRADGPPRAGREGLGIGLALARELVELHGGRIGTQLDASDGTVFWFDLPLGTAHIALDDLQLGTSPAPLSSAAPAQANGGVLLVEDHPELAIYLSERLAEFYPVRTVADAEQALACLHEGAVQVVVSDVVLPGQDGVALCRQIKSTAETAAIPVILISAKSNPGNRQEGLDAGALAWLSKPFAVTELLGLIGQCWPDDAAPPVAPEALVRDGREGSDPLLLAALQRLSAPDFGVSEWAQIVHLSDRQLRRRVTELTGLAPIVWLREQRLLRVRQQISDGSCATLAEAGLRNGFDNANYLYRLYRARFGES